MNNLKNEDLVKVSGGAFRVSKFGIFGTIICFTIGFLSGFSRPSTCKSGS